MRAKEYKNCETSNYSIISEKGNPSFDNNVYLAGLKKVNIFVGANNSGKSRFLRQIFKAQEDDFVFFEDVNSKLEEIYQNLFHGFGDLFFMNDLKALTESRTGNYIERFNIFVEKIEKVHRSKGQGGIWDDDVARDIKFEMKDLGIFKRLTSSVEIKRRHMYVPILRGLRHLDFQGGSTEKADVYNMRTNKDYEFGFNESETKDIFTGLTVYSEIKKMLLGSRDEREFIKEFEDFISKSFFHNKNITLIPDHDTDILKINIDNNVDRNIFDVGDGIQSIIINTFQAFRYKNENLVLFIEEPEMMMHPSVQRILIETLISKFDKLQVFLTTHSNHFLDLTYDYPNDVAIFSFEETSAGKFNIKDIGYNVKILDLLGVRNSSVFLSNCVIWTEGVTDGMILRKLLKLENLEHKEDYHYSFAEYGGNNLENFDFIEEVDSNGVSVASITKTNFLVADNDNIKGDTVTSRKKPKFIRRKKIEKILGKANFFDKHIEIENLIPYKVWVAVVNKILSDKPGKRIKQKTIKTSDEEKFNNGLGNKKIGFLLKKYLVEENSEGSLKGFEADSVQCLGEDKKRIMRYVIEVIDELGLKMSDFSQEAQSLVYSIIAFINTSNKK